MYRYTVPLYTTCKDGLYFCVHNCRLMYNLTLHLWCTHHARVSCTAVCLYCSPVSDLTEQNFGVKIFGCQKIWVQTKFVGKKFVGVKKLWG